MDDKQLRVAILTVTNDANNSGALPVPTSVYMQRVQFPLDSVEDWIRVCNALKYLTNADYIQSRSIPLDDGRVATHMVTGITPKGVDTVEQSGELRTQVSATTVNFHGPVGSVQQGNHNTANVVQNIGADIGKLVEALVALRDATATDDNAAVVNALAAQAIDEASRTQSVTTRLTNLVTSIGSFIQTSGAVIPAYHAVYLAAPHVGIHGLPPPPTSP